MLGGLLLQETEFSFARSRVVLKPTCVQRINSSAKPIVGVRSGQIKRSSLSHRVDRTSYGPSLASTLSGGDAVVKLDNTVPGGAKRSSMC